MANPNYLFFYPTTVLIALLPGGLGYSLHYILSFAWAALGAYLLARRWDQSRLAASFAAAVFAFSGPVLSLGNLYNQAAAASWIPWALLATDCAVRRRSRRAWIPLGVVFALQFLGAEPLTLYATVALSLSYALLHAWSHRRPASASWAASNERPLRCTVRVLLAFGAVGLIMLALSAVQLLPSLDVLYRARRGVSGLPYGEVVYWSLHPLSLLELVLPGLFGSAFDPSPLWTYVLAGRNQPYYVSIFVGFVPLLLAWLGWSEGRGRRRMFAGFGAILLLLLACGRYTPFFAEAYLLFPPLAVVRFPPKLLVPAVLLLAILAGWGLDVIRYSKPSVHRRRTEALLLALGTGVTLIWVLSLAAPQSIERAGSVILQSTNRFFARSSADQIRLPDLQSAASYLRSMVRLEFPGLMGFFFAGSLWLRALSRGHPWAGRGLPVVVALGVVQIVWANYGINPTVPSRFYDYRPPVIEQPPDPSGPYRFAFIQRDQSLGTPQPLLNFDSVPDARSLSPAAQLAFRDRLLLNRGAMLTGVEMAENLDMEGSLPPNYYEFWIHETQREPNLAWADCLLGRANVKYVVRQVPAASATTRAAAPIINGSPDASELYEDLCFMPQAYAVRDAVGSASGQQTLAMLSDPKFDARSRVILEGLSASTSDHESSQSFADSELGSIGSSAAGSVRVLVKTSNTVELQAEMRQAGWLVLLDRWDPGWQATVDGRPAAVMVANHMFRAVQLGSGAHRVEFSYRPRGLLLGATISVLTFVALTITWFGGRNPA